MVAQDFLAQFQAGNARLLGVAVYAEDKYLPDQALRVALDQVALLRAEIERTPELMLCTTFAEIERAGVEKRIALLLTMEGRGAARRRSESAAESFTTSGCAPFRSRMRGKMRPPPVESLPPVARPRMA